MLTPQIVFALSWRATFRPRLLDSRAVTNPQTHVQCRIRCNKSIRVNTTKANDSKSRHWGKDAPQSAKLKASGSLGKTIWVTSRIVASVTNASASVQSTQKLRVERDTCEQISGFRPIFLADKGLHETKPERPVSHSWFQIDPMTIAQQGRILPGMVPTSVPTALRRRAHLTNNATLPDPPAATMDCLTQRHGCFILASTMIVPQ